MIRRNQEFLNRVNIILDMLLVVAAYMLASWLRLDFFEGDSGNMAGVSGRTIMLAVAYALMLFFLLSMMGFYNTTRTRKLSWKFRTIFLAVTLSTLIATTLFFVFRLVDFSRGVILAFYVLTLAFLFSKYAFMRLVLSRFRGKGYNLKHVVVIGTGKLAKQYRDDITAEAELGVILGKACRDVSEENWLDAVAGYTTILDMTEESILKGNVFLKGNPRYLTIAKNFPTFFSFGPQLVTPDEVPDVLKLEVQSVRNGQVFARNSVSNMTHRPARLVSLHSSIQGWYPGDVLSTGTPRAFALADGDIAECRIVGPEGFSMEPLVNPVVDLKTHPDKA